VSSCVRLDNFGSQPTSLPHFEPFSLGPGANCCGRSTNCHERSIVEVSATGPVRGLWVAQRRKAAQRCRYRSCAERPVGQVQEQREGRASPSPAGTAPIRTCPHEGCEAQLDVSYASRNFREGSCAPAADVHLWQTGRRSRGLGRTARYLYWYPWAAPGGRPPGLPAGRSIDEAPRRRLAVPVPQHLPGGHVIREPMP
jgi:hypothetical protein